MNSGEMRNRIDELNKINQFLVSRHLENMEKCAIRDMFVLESDSHFITAEDLLFPGERVADEHRQGDIIE